MSSQHPAADPLFLSFQLALAGHYSIDRELGRGGMGVVYLAREVDLDRLVAIKLLPPEKANQPLLRDRFLREARLAAKLSHPHIIPIHSVDETDGFVYFVMSFVDGDTLAQRIRKRGPLPATEGTRILREVAWALSYAHGQGLVHRDVKPDNILLEATTGRALVADFGIAAAIGDVSTSGVSGTPEFMSPEQVLDEHVDARSDIYGLGVTAFYALSGRFPFEGSSPTEVLAKQVAQPAPPLSSMGTGVPRKLAMLVDKCLAKEPSERPASADALAEQLGVAMEQRRELPAALRAFVRRSGRMNGGGTVLYASALLIASVGISAALGIGEGFAVLVGGAAIAPVAFAANAARRLARMGFAHADLAPAFKAELETAREEHAVEHGLGRSIVEKTLARVASVFGSYSLFAAPLIGIGMQTDQWHDLAELAIPVTMLAGGLSVVAGLIYLGALQARRDIDTEFWARAWQSRLGTIAFAVAKRLRIGAEVNAAMTHRATELSLGMAAEQLYESLPKEMRQSLGDLPSLLARLQRDARSLRARHDELNDALTRISTITAADEYEQLRAERTLLHDKLRDTVGAMETIRLNLLRLHAGAATVEGVTTHLGIAAEVSAEVERLIAAQGEVEERLRLPRPITATPG